VKTITVWHCACDQQAITHVTDGWNYYKSRKGKLLSTKHGRHLTRTQFRDAARMDDDDTEQEQIKKQAREAVRERKRKAKEWRTEVRERRKR
jgi:hypothetical protein